MSYFPTDKIPSINTSDQAALCRLERINVDEQDEMWVEGYTKSVSRNILFWLSVISTLGFIFILTAWKPAWRVRLTHAKCSLERADKVILHNFYGEEYVEIVSRPDRNKKELVQLPYFYHKELKYIWQSDLGRFCKLTGLEGEKCGYISSMTDGLRSSDARPRLMLYGYNSIIIEDKSVMRLIFHQIKNPLYVYQIFIIVVWMIQMYYQFAGCVLLFSIVSISLHVHETRKQSSALRKKVQSESEVVVLRDGNMESKSSMELVPGDVIILSSQTPFRIECDAVLVSGSCIVDESMLTGESIPISKVALAEDPEVKYSPTHHKKSTLFCGTEIIHVQATDKVHVKALVVRTGYYSAKGELVRNILFPKPLNTKLKQDLIKCMILFFILGIPPMIYTALIFSSLEAFIHDIIIIVFDIGTFLVPPLLPTVMTSVNVYAQKRLRRQDIYCLNSNFINASANVDIVCFDKTGTLTEDSIDVAGVVPCDHGNFKRAERNLQELSEDNGLAVTIANCHSLIYRDGKLDGDRLEIRMFEALGSQIEENFVNNKEAFERLPDRVVSLGSENDKSYYGLFRLFPFDSSLQRMTVVVKKSWSNDFLVLMKGAPEMVSSFCTASSLPENFNSVLGSYTRDGMRVIAAASKEISELTLSDLKITNRSFLESNLTFHGLIVFQNPLKPKTYPTLQALREVGLRVIMATGDNILTALSVARNAGMIEESDSVVQIEANLVNEKLEVDYRHTKLPGFSEKLNMEENSEYANEIVLPMLKRQQFHVSIGGKSFQLIRDHDRNLLAKIIHKGTIFARMSPDHKIHLIDEIQKQGHHVAMCGDGANDCGALRIADCGVSLSFAESSVAAPFTYSEKNIECIPILIREGRASLAATVGAFKYQTAYCFALLAAVLILFWDGVKTSDGGFVFVDIILNILPPLVFGTTEAFPKLTKDKPPRKLFSFLPLFSIFSFVILQVFIYLIAREYLVIQPWYEANTFNATSVHHPEPSHISLTIYSVNTMSYVIAATIFAPGPPFRKSFFSNKLYISVVTFNFFFVILVTLWPSPKFLLDYVKFKDVPVFKFKLVLFGLSCFNFAISYFWEVFLLRALEKSPDCLSRWRSKEPLYSQVETELKIQNDWPPVETRKRNRSPSLISENSLRSQNTRPFEERLGSGRTFATFLSSKSKETYHDYAVPYVANRPIC